MGVSDSEVFIVVVIDLNHRSIDARSQTLNLADGEELVIGHLARTDAKVFLACCHHLVAATEPARCCCANLKTNTKCKRSNDSADRAEQRQWKKHYRLQWLSRLRMTLPGHDISQQGCA